ILVPHLKTIITVESPTEDDERTVSMPGVPFTALSIGKVISASTSSGESPGASVCTTTCGGANSGKTSTGICPTRYIEAPKKIAVATTIKSLLFSDHLIIALNIYYSLSSNPPLNNHFV